MSDWRDKSYDYRYIRMRAGVAHPEIDRSSVEWLKEIGIIPEGASAYTSSRTLGSVSEESIPAWWLAQFAYEFDKEGEGTPIEFVKSVSFEVRGTKERRNFEKLMDDLSNGSNK